MQRQRTTGTLPEARLWKILRSEGVAFRKNYEKMPGSPDAYVDGIAIFVHGCFWHACKRHCKAPKKNAKFWREKFWKNRARHERDRRRLNILGVSVVTLWEHDSDDRIRSRILRAVASLGFEASRKKRADRP